MRILAIHTYYRIRGGEDLSFDGETQLLRELGHTVRTFVAHNRDLETMPIGTRLRSITWNRVAANDLDREIARFAPDVIYLNNVFMALSASVAATCVRTEIPLLVAVRNFRLSCVSGTLFRAGRSCTSCVTAGRFAPGVLHRCHHGSLASSAVASLSASAIKREILGTQSLGRHPVEKQPPGKHVHFAAISSHVARYLTTLGVPDSRIFVKPNTLYPDPGAGPGPGASRELVFVGRLEPEKGIGAVVDAFSRLPETSAKLTIIGSGSMLSGLQAAARRDNRISITSGLRHDEVLARLGRARCSIVPSLWNEPFGRVAVESLARGTPTIVSPNGGLPELVEPGVSGIVVDPDDATALKAALAEMLQREYWGEEGRRAARRRFEDHSSPPVVGARLTQIMSEISSRPALAQ
ncbi:MAG: glycosyltransferase [Frankia sp.]